MVPSSELGCEVFHTEKDKEESRSKSQDPEHKAPGGSGGWSAGCAWGTGEAGRSGEVGCQSDAASLV